MNITLEFNGKQYMIPSDIKDYLEILDITEGVQHELLENFLKKSADSYDGIVYPGDIKSDFTKAAEKYVRLLCEKGVYNETVEDFIATSDGYRTFSKISENASQANLQFSNEEKRNYQTRSQVAERNALSKITGSGVGVYSSSFLTLAMSSAVEYSTLKGQYNKANDQYKRDLAYLRSQGENERKIKEQTYYTSKYLPQAEKTLELFSYEMMQKYLEVLIANRMFNQDALKYIDLERSQKLLGNLKLTSAKKELLETAFLACPFNANVYLELAKLGKLDKKTLHTAQQFDLLDFLKIELEKIFSGIKYTGDIHADLYEANTVISSLSLITGIPQSNYYRTFAQPIYEKTIREYFRIQEIASSKECGLQFLKGHSAKIEKLTEEEIFLLTSKEVKSIIPDKEFYALIEECKFTDLIDKIKWKSDSVKKESIDNYYIETIDELLIKIVNEISIMVDENDKLNQKKLKLLKLKKIIAGCLYGILVLFPIILVFFSVQTWKIRTKNELKNHIETSLKNAQNEYPTSWNQIGGISHFDIEQLRIYKKRYFDIYVEAKLKYYVGSNNADEKNVTKIVENVYKNVKVVLPSHLSIGSNTGEFAPWPWEVVAQKPNGEIMTVDNANSAIHTYCDYYSNGKEINLWVSVPMIILYCAVLMAGFLVVRYFFNEWNSMYINSSKKEFY